MSLGWGKKYECKVAHCFLLSGKEFFEKYSDQGRLVPWKPELIPGLLCPDIVVIFLSQFFLLSFSFEVGEHGKRALVDKYSAFFSSWL